MAIKRGKYHYKASFASGKIYFTVVFPGEILLVIIFRGRWLRDGTIQHPWTSAGYRNMLTFEKYLKLFRKFKYPCFRLSILHKTRVILNELFRENKVNLNVLEYEKVISWFCVYCFFFLRVLVYWVFSSLFSKVSQCQFKPCKNGATCIDLKEDFMCLCTTDYVGKICDCKLVLNFPTNSIWFFIKKNLRSVLSLPLACRQNSDKENKFSKIDQKHGPPPTLLML